MTSARRPSRSFWSRSGHEEKKYRDWIVIHDATQGEMAYALECLRCGQVQKVATPIGINLYLAMGREFERIHARCPEKSVARIP